MARVSAEWRNYQLAALERMASSYGAGDDGNALHAYRKVADEDNALC